MSCVSSQWGLFEIKIFWRMMFLSVLFEGWWCFSTEQHQMRPVASWPGVTGLCYLHNDSRCDVLWERLHLENGFRSWCTLGYLRQAFSVLSPHLSAWEELLVHTNSWYKKWLWMKTEITSKQCVFLCQSH